jgi:hypothetical protein
MWHNGKLVTRAHAKNNTQQAWAIVAGVGTGWLRIKPNTPDGVSNIFAILCAGLANNRRVDVLVVNNEITEATLT